MTKQLIRVLPRVAAVSRSAKHSVRKMPLDVIVLRAGLGVEDDAHAGATIQHRYAKRFNPGKPNLRQVHLIGAELFDELAASGFDVGAGMLGENIATRGIDLMALPLLTRLRIGADAVVELRGVRHPCVLLDRMMPGLTAATSVPRGSKTALRHGVMGVVVHDGAVRPGDAIAVVLSDGESRDLPFV
jgi:MOSC domain-containing protein YiiM